MLLSADFVIAIGELWADSDLPFGQTAAMGCGERQSFFSYLGY